MTNYITKTIKNGVEANIPVTSVNGQYGDVTIQTGGNYTAGNGIDITNDEIGLDGTYDKTTTHSDMQGPAPDGFHVPSRAEWQGVKTIMDGLSLTTTNSWRINLHMPFAGTRSRSQPQTQGTYGYYWTSIARGENNAYLLSLESFVNVDSNLSRTSCYSVRCFKDSYVTPDSSWTVIQGTLGSAGIFWNQTEGLISITNGTTGYTMMDKNLGATTVYNDGDTLTQDNMGNMYQWGNNYGFPSTGAISKISSEQVDASNYGPGNYYKSDTFIDRTSVPYVWESSNNQNLRGGVTQGTWVSQNSGNLVLGDKLYKIVTSTTAPASGTASNIITIVTD